MKDLGRPHNIIVNEDGDPRLDFRYRSAHLSALVRLPNAQDSNLFGVDPICQLGKVVDIGIDGDQDQLKGLSLETCLEGSLKLIAALGNGWQDDGDIL